MNINTKLPKYMTVVDNKLIRGKAVISPLRLYKMKEAGITQIIDLRNTSFAKKPLERFFCKLLGIKYLNFKYPHRINYLPEFEFFKNINKTIVANNGKTYIHCQYGKRRTGIAVALYEKFYSNKKSHEILENMLKIGYKDVLSNSKNRRNIRYQAILNELIEKYFKSENSLPEIIRRKIPII